MPVHAACSGANNGGCVLELLEAKGTGIFSMIDEEISVPKGSDEGLHIKVQQLGKGHPAFKMSRSGGPRLGFTIAHYAGAVTYDADGFLVKGSETPSFARFGDFVVDGASFTFNECRLFSGVV